MAENKTAVVTTLQQIIDKAVNVSFEFVDIQMGETQDGGHIMRLILKDPIPKVLGRTVFEGSGRRLLEADGVQIVSILPDGIRDITELQKAGEPVFQWTVEGKSGKVNSAKVKLDVARNSGDVFLVVERLGNRNRQQNQGNSRVADLLKMINDDAAKQLNLKSTPEPTA